MFLKKNEESKVAKKESTEQLQERVVFTPRFDVYSNPTHIYLEGNLPGTREEDIEISIEKGVLSIYAKGMSMATEGYHDYENEFDFGDFRRSFQLGQDINTDSVEAAYKNGVLYITLPIKNAVQKKIPVSAGD